LHTSLLQLPCQGAKKILRIDYDMLAN
jgi:hypothetical protein